MVNKNCGVNIFIIFKYNECWPLNSTGSSSQRIIVSLWYSYMLLVHLDIDIRLHIIIALVRGVIVANTICSSQKVKMMVGYGRDTMKKKHVPNLR